MTETNTRIRLATTAIAAALAISSTTLPAQDAPPPDTSVETPVTAAPDPLSPEPAINSSVAPETTVAPEATPATSAASKARTTKAATTRRATATSRPVTRPAPAAVATAVTPAPAAAAAEPDQGPPAEVLPVEPAAPVAVAPAASRQAQMNVFLAIGGAILLGLIALVATVVALRRRRRRAELLDNEATVAEADATETAPAMTIEPEPAFMAAPGVAPATAVEPEAVAEAVAEAHEPSPEIAGPVTEIPEGFDLSRFGPHTQAAYRGPTEENPSLSLKYRLRKAAALDQLAKREAEAELAAEAESAPVKAVAAEPEAVPAGSDFMLRNNGTKTAIRRAYSE